MPIAANNISYTYSKNTPFEHTAVSDLSLTIREGDYIGMIGHTGSGKTTLIKILCGLLPPSSGTLTLNGEEVYNKKFDKRKLRQQIGVVFQYPEYQLFEETVKKDIAFGPTKQGHSPEEVEKRVCEAMELLGIPEHLGDKSPFELSGGQKRLCALAGVLAMKPKFLFLDEPVAGLDPVSREHLFEVIQRLNAQGTAIILITHSMDDLAQHAKKVFVLNGGRLAFAGTPAEIFSRPEELKAMGLNVPQVSELVLMLKNRGVVLPSDLVTVDQLIEYVRSKRCKHA